MITSTSLALDQVHSWLHDWEQALSDRDINSLRNLWTHDCHWRDLLALDWNLRTNSGRERVCEEWLERAHHVHPRNWSFLEGPLGIRAVKRAGEDTIECVVHFETDIGPCEGILRLCPDTADSGRLKAWTFMTALIEIRGHEEKYKKALSQASAGNRTFLGPNWLEKREIQRRFDDRSPEVLVIGAGQSGLSVAARLGQLGIDTLVVDSNPRVGDNWRKRYKALVLHNQVFANHFPYMPFPDTWPVYIPKDMLAGWLEYYAQAMELNVWTGSAMTGATYDSLEKRWTANVQQDGRSVTVRPRHIIVATGVSAIPDRSPVEGLENYAGKVMHSADYESPEDWIGKQVVVLGTGTSAHDVAQDLCEHGAQVTMIQRSPTMVQNVEPTAQLPYTIYKQGDPVAYCDLVTAGTPMGLYLATNRIANEMALELDRDLHLGLETAGFRLNKGEDGIGWQLMYLQRGGGYYFNVGCSDLIIQKKIKITQLADVVQFEKTGLRLKNGDLLTADLIVVAKGYLGQSAMVERLFGKEVAGKVGQVWGIDPHTQELSNMWRPTPQPGLWFHAGSLAQCRIFSKYLALQIQAQCLGLQSEHS